MSPCGRVLSGPEPHLQVGARVGQTNESAEAPGGGAVPADNTTLPGTRTQNVLTRPRL